ncbi:MAG: glycosyltransferase [Solirubrobacteraceae bacterium]
MPRPDLAALEHGAASARLRRRSGFWATVPIPARGGPGTLALEVSARLADGSFCRGELGRVQFTEEQPPAPLRVHPARDDGPLIAVCMATYEPDMSLFTAQLDSLRGQSDDRWVCVISDDCSRPEHFQLILEAIGDDERFAISRSDQRLGFYRNFERALRLAPAAAELLALCDQDDRWHPDKLETLRAALGSATLVYSDQRIVDAGGRVLRDTLWAGRRNNHTDLAAMLVANTITGAAALFTRELTELALPFPDTPGLQFHDHWLGVMALAAGEVAYVERPLYDYVQHPGAVFGDVTHGPGIPARPPGAGLRNLPGRLGGRLRHRLWTNWRAAYFYGYASRETQAQVVLARLAGRLTTDKQAVLRRFVACDSSLRALVWLAMRGLRPLAGRTETLGSELALVQGVIWKMLAQARARLTVTDGGPFGDAGVPPPQEFSQRRLRRWRARV